MKQILSICIFLSLATAASTQNFYQLSFTNIDGGAVSLNTYSGKKVLFFILPVSQSDSNFLQLQTFKNRYLDTVQVIGIPSFEDGYQSSGATALKALYGNMGIVITEGMYTKKTSGSNQSGLMKWLTNKSKNQHFDMDAAGIGHKFFVSGTGREYAVMPPQVSLSLPVIDRIVHSNN